VIRETLMQAEYDSATDTFTLGLTRSEAIDLSVFTGMRGNVSWLRLNGLGDLHGKLRWVLDQHPSVDVCEHCELPVVYVEGEWRHVATCRAFCGLTSRYRAQPRREN
jgi:hypothetical protein